MMRRSINVHFRAESVRRLVARRSSQQPAAAFVLALSEECEFKFNHRQTLSGSPRLAEERLFFAPHPEPHTLPGIYVPSVRHLLLFADPPSPAAEYLSSAMYDIYCT